MNAISLYVSTSRLVFQTNVDDKTSWADLNRLVPFLRQSLSCTVCDKLLIEPLTPTESTCQHHVCRTCKGGRKKLKPSCSWCKDYGSYVENVQLRILLQCYKKLCGYILRSAVFQSLAARNASKPLRFPVSRPTGIAGETQALTLMDLIQEGAGFKDEYKSSSNLPQSAYANKLPCMYELTSTGTQTQSMPPEPSEIKTQPSYIRRKEKNSESINKTNGNVSTIKVRKPRTVQSSSQTGGNFKKPPQQKAKAASGRSGASIKPKGCRCGKATPTPGQLTCCGQRCPCYVGGKACIDCVCRGCRNPHRAGGFKVRTLIAKQHPIPAASTRVSASRETPETTPLRVSSYFLMDSPSGEVSTPTDESEEKFQVIGSETLKSYHFPYENRWHHYEPH